MLKMGDKKVTIERRMENCKQQPSLKSTIQLRPSEYVGLSEDCNNQAEVPCKQGWRIIGNFFVQLYNTIRMTICERDY